MKLFKKIVEKVKSFFGKVGAKIDAFAEKHPKIFKTTIWIFAIGLAIGTFLLLNKICPKQDFSPFFATLTPEQDALLNSILGIEVTV